MALQDPTSPWSWVPPQWEQQPIELTPPPLAVTAGEYPLGSLAAGTLDPPPPPPPPRDDAARIGAMGAPVADEVPIAAMRAPALTPEEEAQIQIEQPPQAPPLSAAEEAQIEIDEPKQAQSALLTPPYLEADAISGGMTPDQAYTFGLAEKQGSPVAGQTQGVPGEMPEDYLSDYELGQKYADLSPEEQERKRFEVEDAKQKLQLAEQTRIATKNAKDAEDEARDYQTSIKESMKHAAELDAEAVKLGQETIDPLSIGQRIGGALAAMIGGFGASATGGQNMGLAAFEATVNREIERQKANIANKRASLGERRGLLDDQIARGADLHKATETVRIAAYDGAIRKLEADVQQFDPRGSTAVRVMDNINQLRVKRADAIAKFQQQRQKEIEAGLKEQREALKLIQDQQRIDDARKAQREDLGLSYSKLAQDKKEFAATNDLEKQKLGLEAEKLRATGNEKGAKLLLEQGVAAPPEAAVDDAGNVSVKRDTGSMKQADGSTPWIIPTVEEAKDFRKKKAAADGIVAIVDEIRQIRDRVGGESSWGNSDDYQRLQVLKNNLTIIKKSGTQGMSSDEDMKKIDASLGAKDPTSFRAMAAGLDEGREQTIRQLDTEARSLGYTGKALHYTDPLKNRAAKSPEQASIERVMAFDPARDPDMMKEFGIEFSSMDWEKDLADALEKHGGFPPSVRRVLDDLRATVGNEKETPKKREMAREALERISNSAESPKVRAYALSNAFDPAATVKTAPEETE